MSEAEEIEVVAHCLLDPFTRVRGLSPVPFRPRCAGLVQLPCPEALYLGLDRWAVTRDQMDLPQFRRFCRSVIEEHADLLEMLAGRGLRIRIVGVAGSPCCGILTTSAGYTGGRVHEAPHRHVSGRGILMEELLAELERRGVAYYAEEVGGDER
ncbi:MAG: hypothetical protein QUS08_06495 [Methanothrix sp.]|nr:hypothetical protein [Methanothrix sp.]